MINLNIHSLIQYINMSEVSKVSKVSKELLDFCKKNSITYKELYDYCEKRGFPCEELVDHCKDYRLSFSEYLYDIETEKFYDMLEKTINNYIENLDPNIDNRDDLVSEFAYLPYYIEDHYIDYIMNSRESRKERESK